MIRRKVQQARAPNARYVQFSKRIIVAVTSAVTGLCAAAALLCYLLGDTDWIVDVVKAYISYATIAFAAYSGNSAVEKWLVKRYGDEVTETDETNCG